jgi:hypothetical protein
MSKGRGYAIRICIYSINRPHFTTQNNSEAGFNYILNLSFKVLVAVEATAQGYTCSNCLSYQYAITI